jgi:uncharacterized protein HemX
MNNIDTAIEFFAKYNETTAIELTNSELRAVRSALSDKILNILELTDIDFDVKMGNVEIYRTLRDKFENKIK